MCWIPVYTSAFEVIKFFELVTCSYILTKGTSYWSKLHLKNVTTFPADNMIFRRQYDQL